MEALTLNHKKALKLDKDYEAAAKVADLIYVSDKAAGIIRKKAGSGFSYLFNGKPVKDAATLERIKKLAIPPAWTEVWICTEASGHIQATGKDARGRKQYRYHASWQTVRGETKFHRLYEFGNALPSIRETLKHDLALKELSEEKVLATVVSVMERTCIRVGNDGYEKLYGSYGLTTMKDAHVKVNGSHATFCFKGKKGILHKVDLQSKKLAKLVQRCKEIPGKELFQYYDGEGKPHPIDSGMVNRYIKQASGGDFTAKDFRTWAGTLHILHSLHRLLQTESEKDVKKNVLSALDEVSSKLGNTRTVCKKYYVHPGIIKLYEDKALNKYTKELDAIEVSDTQTDLSASEKVLMKILKDLM